MATSNKKFKIKEGDEVIVNTGRDKGKQGKVLKVLKEKDRLVVQGVNLVKRHEKPSATSAGGINQKESTIHVSNVSVVDPKDNKGTKIGFKTLDNGEKVCVSRRTGEVIS